MVGSGRKFEESGFIQKLEEIEGYVVSDIYKFPNIPYWIIPHQIVRDWWTQGQLGNTTKISREKALSLLKRIFNVS
jgi:hypothetical protein